jgi:hypothetical protein
MAPTQHALDYETARVAMRHISAIELHLIAILDLFDDPKLATKHPLALAAVKVMNPLQFELERPIYLAFPELHPEKDVLRMPKP